MRGTLPCALGNHTVDLHRIDVYTFLPQIKRPFLRLCKYLNKSKINAILLPCITEINLQFLLYEENLLTNYFDEKLQVHFNFMLDLFPGVKCILH